MYFLLLSCWVSEGSSLCLEEDLHDRVRWLIRIKSKRKRNRAPCRGCGVVPVAVVLAVFAAAWLNLVFMSCPVLSCLVCASCVPIGSFA